MLCSSLPLRQWPVGEAVARIYLACRDAGHKVAVESDKSFTFDNGAGEKVLEFLAHPAGIPGTGYRPGTFLYG